MRLKKKIATAENIKKLIEKYGGRIGTKDTDEIKKLVADDKLLEAFFSVISILQWQLQANFDIKFHFNHIKGALQRKEGKHWELFTETFDKFSAIITLSYLTDLIDESTYNKLNDIRKLRNDIVHKLTYYEPEIFITKKEVKDSISIGLGIIKNLRDVERDIVFGRK